MKYMLRYGLMTLAAVNVWMALDVCAAPILLKSGAIDVDSSVTAVKRASSASVEAASCLNKYIIQHDGKIPAAWRQSILDAGAEILRYIPENAYLISVDETSLSVVRDQVTHTALLPYVAEYRVDPSVATALTRTTASLSAASGESSSDRVETNTVTYAVSLFSDKVREAYVAKINALAHCRVVKADGDVIRANLTSEGVAEVSAYDEVEYIAIWIAPKLSNNVSVQAARMNVETVWPDGATGLGLTGKGQVVAVADTGLDTGDLSTVHKDVRGRISRAYARGRTNDWSDPDGHGTHVVGSVLGDGSCSTSPKIRGVAYEATLIMQSTEDSWGDLSGIPTDLKTLFSQAYNDDSGKAGARIHSNSWGSSLSGYYSSDTKNIDSFTFSHPDMLILFAASNDGVDSSPKDGVIDGGSISSEATAKNGISVGASENYRTSGGYSTDTWGECWPSDYSKDPIKSDRISYPYDGTHQGIAAFSSRGPCNDGRIKPDIVAPGTDILSMRSSCGGTLWASYDTYYQYCGGTSMATPLVAGTAALVRQWLVENRSIANPDAATIKAVLLAGAKSLTPGQYGTESYREIPASYPNNVEGWGQVNLGKSLVNANGLLVYDAKVIQDDETQTYTFSAKAGSSLTIVMAYADAAASLSASKQLVNDLDLKVVSPSGTVHYPNSRSSADRYNNVEGVRLSSAEGGIYTVTVTGYSVNTPMSTTLTDGKSNAIRYSLVANGAVEGEAAKTVISFSANGGTGGPSGTVTATNGQPMPTITASPSRTDYEFSGYFDGTSDSATKYYNANLSSARYWDKTTATATLYAHWKKPSAVITVGGVAKEYEYGQSVTLTPPASSVGIHGYTNSVCKGWTGTGCVPASGTGSSVTFTVTGPGTLDWTYQRSYYFCVTKSGTGTVSYGTDGLTAYKTGYWAPSGTKITLTATPGEHYHFTAWKNAETSATLSSAATYTATLSQPRLILAVFGGDTYTVTFDIGSYGIRKSGELTQSVGYGQAATAPTITAKAGSIFTGWSPSDFSYITKDLTVKALYGFSRYSISYEDTFGCDNSANPAFYTVTNATIKFKELKNAPTGNTFLGWTPDSIKGGSVGDKTVFAQWACDFSLNGAAPVSYKRGETLEAKTIGSRVQGETNIVCTGWLGTGSVPASGTVNRVVFKLNEPSSLTWLYATNYWVSATVDASSSSRSGGTVKLRRADGGSLANGVWIRQGEELVAEAVADQGWGFVGWEATGIELVDAASTNCAFVVNEPIRLKARFTQLHYTVTFDLGAHGVRTGGGTLEQDVFHGAAALAPTLDVENGWNFIGWSQPFDRIVEPTAVSAKYEPAVYAIAYTETMGCDNSSNPTNYTIEDAVTFVAPTNPPGWRFLGWLPSAIAAGTAGDVAVTGNWEHIRYTLDLAGVKSDEHYYGDVVTVSESCQNIVGTTNVVCLGWTGTGDVTDGVGTQVTFTVTQPSSLSWNYATNYWIEAGVAQAAEGGVTGGRVTLYDASRKAITNEFWALAGTNLTVLAVAEEGWQFDGWVDDDSKVSSYTDTATRSLTVEAATRVFAKFAKRSYVNEVDGMPTVVTHGETLTYRAPIVNVTNGTENVICTGWTGTGDVPVTGSETEVSFTVTQPSTLNWLYVTNNLGFAFAETETSVTRGETLRIAVRGGSREAACSVQVLLLEQSAKKSDLNLKEATVDGATPKGGLAFPLSLAWESGDMSERIIEIPVKTVKTADQVRFLTFELADSTGLKIGDDRLCTVTVNGEDTKSVYVRPIAWDAVAGKVSGGKSVKPNKNGGYAAVTLKATVNKGYWFAGWYDASGERVGESLSLKVTPDGSTALPTYLAHFVQAETNCCGTYRGFVRVNLKGMTLVKDADTSSDVWGDYAVSAVLSTAGKVSGSITVGGKKVSFKGESCLEATPACASFPVSVEEKPWFSATNAETLRLTFTEDGEMTMEGLESAGPYAPLAGRNAGGVYRDAAKDKTATAQLAMYQGLYAGALAAEDGRIVPLSITLDAKGKVKISGLFWDGSSLAASGQLARKAGDVGKAESAVAELILTPRALGCGSYHLTIGASMNERVTLALTARATTYTAQRVFQEAAEQQASAYPYAALCWVPEGSGDGCAVTLAFEGETLTIPCTVKNGIVTGLGKSTEKGVTVKFAAKTGILTVTKTKSWTIQGVLGDDAEACSAVGYRSFSGETAPAEVSIGSPK